MNSRVSQFLLRLCCAKLLPWLMLAVGLLATCLAYQAAMNNAHRILRENFDYRTREIVGKIEHGIAAYKIALHGASGLLAGNTGAGRKEFSDYVQRLQLAKKIPGILAVGFTRGIPLAKHGRAVAGQRDFAHCIVYPEVERAVRYIASGGESLHSRPCTIDQNIHFRQESRFAMQQARDENRIVMTGKATITLDPDGGSQQGFVLYLPVFQSGSANGTAAERRASIVGWVYAAFRMDDWLTGTLGEYGGELALAAHESDRVNADALIVLAVESSHSGPSLLAIERRMEIAGYPWSLKIRSLPEFESRLETGTAQVLMLSGILVSAMLFMYVWLLTSGRERAVALANDMTRDLQESESRWKFALEGSGDALWDWNVQTDSVYFSSRWKAMLGFANDEIGNGFDEREQRLHPDDRAQAKAAIASLLDGSKVIYQSEFRLQCKEGNWKWVLDRGMVVSHDGNGKPLRVIGTQSDIDDRKAAEMRISRLTQLYAALSHCNQAIVRAASEAELFSEICRVAVEFGGMKMAWIGMADDVSGRVGVVASCGMTPEYLDEMRFLVDVGDRQYQLNASASQEGGSINTFIHQQWPLWCQDVQNDPLLAPWRERAEKNGWRALAALPLYRKGVIMGGFCLYAGEAWAFDQDARDLLEEMARDISSALDNFEHEADRKKVEQALRDSETFNITVLDSLVEHIAVLDADAVIVAVNRAWRQFAHENGAPDSTDFWCGAKYIDACEKVLHQENGSTASVARAGIEAVLSGAQPSFEMEYACHSPYQQRWFIMHVTPLGGAHSGAVVAHENISRRKRVELEINAARIRLAELSSQLVEVHESERKNLARELHDELGQRFTTLNIGLHRMQKFLIEPEALEVWQKASEEVALLIQRVRQMSLSLRPPMLDYLGLETSVRQLLQQNFAEGSYVFEYAGLPQKLPGPVEITAYRIIQESLTNITRHAQASHVVIEINGGELGDELEIIIRDNGKGFDTGQMQVAAQRGSFGLVGMRERVTMLGGKFRVNSVVGQGTRLEVQLKLR